MNCVIARRLISCVKHDIVSCACMSSFHPSIHNTAAPFYRSNYYGSTFSRPEDLPVPRRFVSKRRLYRVLYFVGHVWSNPETSLVDENELAAGDRSSSFCRIDGIHYIIAGQNLATLIALPAAAILNCGTPLPSPWKDLPNGFRYSTIVAQDASNIHGAWILHYCREEPVRR